MTETGTVTATLTRRGGSILAEIQLPKSLHQVPLNRFIDFLVECRNFGDESQNQFVVMARAISVFCDHPLSEIIEAELGEDLAALDGSLRGLFGYISNLVYKAKGTLLTPDNASFEYRGETYTIPTITQQMMAGEFSLPDMTVIETVEALEVERFRTQKTQMEGDPDGSLRNRIMALATDQMTEYDEGHPQRQAITVAANNVVRAETEKAGDPNGSLLYSKYLKMIALLCRKPGETLPFEDSKREAWINERAMHFAGIDAQTALNVDFFLTSILVNSAQSHNVVGFLSRQSFVLLASMRLKNERPKSKQRRTTRRSFVA